MPLAERKTGYRRRQHRNSLVLQQRPVGFGGGFQRRPFRIGGERGPGLLARILVGKTRHISEPAVFDRRGERTEQLDAVTREELGRDVVAKAAAHRVRAAFGGFVNPDFVDQNVLPVSTVSLSELAALGATIEASGRNCQTQTEA